MPSSGDLLGQETWRLLPDTMARRLVGNAWTSPPHVRLIAYFLYLASTGKIGRLGISLPPGHAKSTTCSQFFPTWHFDHWPDARIILSQYAAELAEEWGKAVRQTIEENQNLLRVTLRKDSLAANRWRTYQGGGMWTTGAGGAITGRRAKIFLIDDPHKNFAEAYSETIRTSIWNWYTSTARTRLLPGGAVVVIMTRWHEDDLMGRLLANDTKGMWTYLRLPAVAEVDETIETVIGDETAARLRAKGVPLPEWHRAAGEALWPELTAGVPYYDLNELQDIRDEVGEHIWTGLYQQRPTALEGEMFKRHDWKKVDAPPANLDLVRRWDMAAGEKKTSDWTAGVLMGRPKTIGDTRTFILDIQRRRIGPADKKKFIREVAESDAQKYKNVSIKIEREGGSAGLDVENEYVTDVLHGFDVEFIPSTGDKTVRALPLAGQQGVGNVFICRRETETGYEVPDWWEPFITESASFPYGAHDDMIDAASAAFADLVKRSKRRTKARVSGSAERTLVDGTSAIPRRPDLVRAG